MMSAASSNIATTMSMHSNGETGTRVLSLLRDYPFTVLQGSGR